MSDEKSGPTLAFAPKGTFRRRVALTSYPRSGNSLVRRLLERATGLYSGSDTRPDRAMSVQLRDFGMLGEGVADSTVWLVKTHYPERRGHRPFRIDRAILVVRNPFDAVDSYFNMVLTQSHTNSIEECEYERFHEAWRAFARREVDMWKRFHNFWAASPVPVLFARYEDLVRPDLRPRLLAAMIRFINAASPQRVADPEATAVRVCAEEDAGRVYNPRSGMVGGSLRHFTPADIRFVMRETHQHTAAMGYLPLLLELPAVAAAAMALVAQPIVAGGSEHPAGVTDESADEAVRFAALEHDTAPTYDLDSKPIPGVGLAPAFEDEVPPPAIVAQMASAEAYAAFALPAEGCSSGAMLLAGRVREVSLCDFPDAEASVLAARAAGEPFFDVNLGVQIRPCTPVDPWGRGMRWMETLPVSQEAPILVAAKRK